MAIYFQHVGEAGAKRDFPKSIGAASNETVKFNFGDISDYVVGYSPAEQDEIRQATEARSPNGFQIWGIPSGAKSILRNFSVGDHLLLLESITEGGYFRYAGKAVALLKFDQYKLSQHLWGEPRFPIILFLDGAMINHSWHKFCEEFGYKKNWNPAGNTYEIKSKRIIESPYQTEKNAIDAILPLTFGRQDEEASGFTHSFEETAQDDLWFAEGNKKLQVHLVAERSSGLVREFKKRLSNPCCEVCGFDFNQTYGELGRGYIEAHHVVPLSMREKEKVTSLKDLVPVCSNCRRMLHRTYPGISVDDLKKRLSQLLLDRL